MVLGLDVYIEYSRFTPEEQAGYYVFLGIAPPSELKTRVADVVLTVCNIQERIHTRLTFVLTKLKGTRCHPYCDSLVAHSYLNISDAGITTCDMTGVMKGKGVKLWMHFTEVYTRTNGRWHWLLWQSTRLPEQPPA